jgi:hypothetical protein
MSNSKNIYTKTTMRYTLIFTYKAKALCIKNPECLLGLVDWVCFPHLKRIFKLIFVESLIDLFEFLHQQDPFQEATLQAFFIRSVLTHLASFFFWDKTTFISIANWILFPHQKGFFLENKTTLEVVYDLSQGGPFSH